MEGWSLIAGSGDVDVVDPRDYWPDEFFGVPAGLAHTYARPDDREQGEQPPTLETQTDLDLMWGLGRLLGDINCAGIGLIGALTNYTIGDGWVLAVEAHPRARAG